MCIRDRWRADAAKRKKREAKQGLDGRRRRAGGPILKVIAAEDGGHQIVRSSTGQGWMCLVCKKRTMVKKRLEVTKCGAAKKKAWAAKGPFLETEPSIPVLGHMLRQSGQVTWCGVCGAFAETRANHFLGQCPGPPPAQYGSGGRRAQLLRLRASLHPVSMQRLPEARLMDGSLVNAPGYARKNEIIEVDDGFVRYEPTVLHKPDPEHKAESKTADEKRKFMHAKVRLRELTAKRIARRERREQRDVEVNELISSLVDVGPEVMRCEACNADDADFKEFWDSLIPSGEKTSLVHIEDTNARRLPGGWARAGQPTRRSRLQMHPAAAMQ